MSNMRFSAPASVEETIALLLGDKDARLLAGGTDLLVQMQWSVRKASHVIDIKRIPELNTIHQPGKQSGNQTGNQTGRQSDNGSWILGAAICSAELNENAALKKQWPGVLEAADLIGSMQVQSRATLAGNLCNASPAADSVPALVAASATVTIAGVNGRRTVPVETIPTAPGKTSLESGDMIVSINLPARPAMAGDAYMRFIPRSEMDIAVVGVGVFVELDNSGVCVAARVSLGAVASTVLVFDGTDTGLVGTKLDTASLEKSAQYLQSACCPIDDKRGTAEFRTEILGVLFKRTAQKAFERATLH